MAELPNVVNIKISNDFYLNKTNEKYLLSILELLLSNEIKGKYTVEVKHTALDILTNITITFNNVDDAMYFKLRYL